MITVRYKERTANRLLQYSMGRALATHLGYAFHAEPVAGFSGLETDVDGLKADGPTVKLSSERGLPEYIDLRTVEAIVKGLPRKPRFELSSFFQDSRNFVPWKADMEKWVPYADLEKSYRTKNDELSDLVQGHDVVCCHVRLGDYEQYRLVLDAAYYAAALSALRLTGDPVKRIIVFTDTPKHAYLDALRAEAADVVVPDVPWPVAFNVMRRARRIVVANSSFSWLAAFLGHPEKVIMPWGWSVNWVDNGGADLRIADGAWTVLKKGA